MLKSLVCVLPIVFSLPSGLQSAPTRTATSALPRVWKLAFVRGGDIWICRGNGTDQHVLIKNGSAPCWSPDHKQIAFARDGNVWIARASGGGERQLTRRWPKGYPSNDEVRNRSIDITWDPHDLLVTFSHEDQYRVIRDGDKNSATIEVKSIYTVPSKKPKRDETVVAFGFLDDKIPFNASLSEHPAFSPNGKMLAFVRNGDVWIAVRHELDADPAWAWTHRSLTAWGWGLSRVIATGSFDADTDHGSHDTCYPTHLAWSPDNQTLALSKGRIGGSGYDWVELYRIAQKDGDLKATKLNFKTDVGHSPCFTPDGKWVTFVVDGNIVAKSIDGKREVVVVRDGYHPAW